MPCADSIMAASTKHEEDQINTGNVLMWPVDDRP
jgi:hypothetical protein